MSRMSNVSLSVALLFAALTLSACATKPKEVTAEPVAPAVAAEKAPEIAVAPATVAEQPAAAPAVASEQVAPKPVVKKAKKKVAKAKVAQPKPVAPEPVPAPVVKQDVPVAAPPAPAPAPVAVIAPPPVQKAEPGFLEKYWLWLLGIVIAVIAVLLFKKKD